MPRTRSQEETPKIELRSRQVKCKNAPSNQNLKRKITKELAFKFLAHADEVVTTEYLDSAKIKSHKIQTDKPTDDEIKLPEFKKVIKELREAYLKSMEEVSFLEKEKYNKEKTYSELGVFTKKAIRKSQTIPGLIGMTALCPPNLKIDFSVLGNKGKKKTERIMLGPASFINHACQPNAEFVVHGEWSTTTLEVKTTRPIKKGEEITLSYGEQFFGTDNKDCGCNDCKRKQPKPVYTEPVTETEQTPEMQTQSVTETEQTPEIPTQSVTETERTPEMQTHAVTETEQTPEMQTQSVTETEQTPEMQTQSVTETEQTPEIPTQSVTETEQTLEMQTHAVTETEQTPDMQTQSVTETEQTPEMQTQSVTETEQTPEMQTQSVTETEQTPEIPIQSVTETEQTSQIQTEQASREPQFGEKRN